MVNDENNTLSNYLGPKFQEKLVWQLLVEPEFAEKVIDSLEIDYFDDPNFKRFFILILEYYNEFGKVPNLYNGSIEQAIHMYKSTTKNSKIDEETLFSVLKKIKYWDDMIINKQRMHDGDVIRESTKFFIKQQEYRKIGEYTLTCIKTGKIKDKKTVSHIEDWFQKTAYVGDDDDDSEEVIDNVTRALRKEFRQTIPTGIEVIDVLTGGGLGKSEIGVILSPSGVGKTTMLTKIANTAYELGKNVAQIIFEDTKDQVSRKHYSIWSGIPLSKIDDNPELVKERVNKKIEELKGNGRIVVKRFSQENTTIKDVINWMLSYQKKWGFKFDELVLDYLDCLESHKRTPDRNEAELAIIKGFEALSSDLEIPAWTAIQSNRSGFDAEFVEAHQSGGSIKRIQKAHFFMSIAKTPDQKEADLANIRIIKARFAKDGQTFNDCIFNNDTMEIRIEDSRYKYSKSYNKGLKKYTDDDLNKVLDKASELELHSKISRIYDNKNVISEHEDVIDSSLTNALDKFKEDFSNPKNTDDDNVSNNNNDNDEVLDKNINEKNDDPFVWNGDTEKNININNKNIHDMLIKKRDNQKVIKKDDKK